MMKKDVAPRQARGKIIKICSPLDLARGKIIKICSPLDSSSRAPKESKAPYGVNSARYGAGMLGGVRGFLMV
jgi:hypothetical protein